MNDIINNMESRKVTRLLLYSLGPRLPINMYLDSIIGTYKLIFKSLAKVQSKGIHLKIAPVPRCHNCN